MNDLIYFRGDLTSYLDTCTTEITLGCIVSFFFFFFLPGIYLARNKYIELYGPIF